jgi:hypothetical protein
MKCIAKTRSQLNAATQLATFIYIVNALSVGAHIIQNYQQTQIYDIKLMLTFSNKHCHFF